MTLTYAWPGKSGLMVLPVARSSASKQLLRNRVRLIQQHGEFAEDGTRLRHPGDLNAFLYDRDRAFLKDHQSAGCRGGAEHGLTGLIGCERKGEGGELSLENRHIGNECIGMFDPPSSLRAATRQPTRAM
jgi:hypothetical protein